MKSALLASALLLTSLSFAQQQDQPPPNSTPPQSQRSSATTRSAQASSGQVNGSPRVAPGSVIPVQLTKSVDAKKVKTGDEVSAKVTQDMKAGNGEIVVPKDTQIVGHITEAQVRSKEQKESQVGIAFDHAIMNPGGEMPLPMSIQAIIAPPTADTSNNNNAAAEGAAPPASGSSAGGMPPGYGGRSAGMGAGNPSPRPSPSTSGGGAPTSSQAGGNKVDQQPITGKTEGVVGISNLKLSTTSSATQGSVLSSEKSNVKLESGTFMLLRVNP